MKNFIISTLTVVMLCLSVNAATVAYWRLEEGSDGSTHTNNLDRYYVDSSGNGNDMSSWYFPAPVGAVPAATIPQSGLENKIALNFYNNMYISTQSKPIDSHDFTGGFTIECAMRNRIVHPANVVNNNPFKLFFAYSATPTLIDKRISYEFTDSDSAVHSLTSSFSYVVGEWYWVACVCDGSEAWLYIKEEDDDYYELEAHITDIVDGMISNTSAWNIGQENFGGSADEVRICDYALDEDQFLAASGGNTVTPVAYWRFEEGTNGVHQGNNDNYYVDSSGNDNHMATDITPVLSVASTDVPFANVPQTGAEDTMSRAFSLAEQNVGTFGEETGGNNIDSMDLEEFTVECMFKYNSLSAEQTFIICKGGDPFRGAAGKGWWECTFGIRIMQNGAISSYFCDKNTNMVHSFSTYTCTPSKWYRLAFVCEETIAYCYVKGEGDTDYEIIATMDVTHAPPGLPIVGGMINNSYPWTIGCGVHDGIVQYPVDGNVDEVRISDTALTPEEFLGSVVPEPGMILGGIALALLAFRRQCNYALLIKKIK